MSVMCIVTAVICLVVALPVAWLIWCILCAAIYIALHIVARALGCKEYKT